MCKSRDPIFYFFYTGVIVRARWRAWLGDARCPRYNLERYAQVVCPFYHFEISYYAICNRVVFE